VAATQGPWPAWKHATRPAHRPPAWTAARRQKTGMSALRVGRSR